MAFAVLSVLALISLLLTPVMLGRIMKQVVDHKSIGLECFALALFGFLVWLWLMFVFSSLPAT